MVRELVSRGDKYNTNEKCYKEYAGLSTDTKPVGDNICTGSLFHEIDSKKVYAYNEEANTDEEWVEQIQLGGDS